MKIKTITIISAAISLFAINTASASYILYTGTVDNISCESDTTCSIGDTVSGALTISSDILQYQSGHSNPDPSLISDVFTDNTTGTTYYPTTPNRYGNSYYDIQINGDMVQLMFQVLDRHMGWNADGSYSAGSVTTILNGALNSIHPDLHDPAHDYLTNVILDTTFTDGQHSNSYDTITFSTNGDHTTDEFPYYLTINSHITTQSLYVFTISSLSTFDYPPSISNTVPEPTSIALLGMGLFGFAASRRKKNQA